MILSTQELNDFILFVTRLKSKQSFLLSGFFRITSRKKNCFKKLIYLLNQMNENGRRIHASRLGVILEYLLKISLIIRGSQEVKLTETANGLFDLDVLPNNLYSFEIHSSLSLKFIRDIRENRNVFNKLSALNEIINRGNCLTLLCDEIYKAECYAAFDVVLEEISLVQNLNTECQYNLLFEKLKLRISQHQNELFLQANENKPVLVYTRGCVFRNDLRRFVNLHKIPHRVLPSYVDVWVRDIFIDGKKKLYIRSRSEVKTESGRVYINTDDVYINTAKYLTECGYYPRKLFVARCSARDRRKHFFREFNREIHGSARPLEGGNLFTAVNKNGETYYFIGINAVLNDLDINIKKRPTLFNTALYHSDIDLKERTKLIQEKYCKIFDTKNVVILPQWTFHLDLQMAYIGNSKFFIHSFFDNEIPHYFKQNIPTDTIHKKFLSNKSEDNRTYKLI